MGALSDSAELRVLWLSLTNFNRDDIPSVLFRIELLPTSQDLPQRLLPGLLLKRGGPTDGNDGYGCSGLGWFSHC